MGLPQQRMQVSILEMALPADTDDDRYSLLRSRGAQEVGFNKPALEAGNPNPFPPGDRCVTKRSEQARICSSTASRRRSSSFRKTSDVR